jgi:hypothetical protein
MNDYFILDNKVKKYLERNNDKSFVKPFVVLFINPSLTTSNLPNKKKFLNIILEFESY